ncbi:hypothetical protein LINGRAPRIM_LOCUS46 [Linum grandiflorum]
MREDIVNSGHEAETFERQNLTTDNHNSNWARPGCNNFVLNTASMADVCGGSAGDGGDENRRPSKEKRDSWKCRMIGIYFLIIYLLIGTMFIHQLITLF